MVKKSILFLAVFVLSMSLSGCGSEVPNESTFKQGFSLNEVVEANGQYLLEETRTLSSSEVGSSEPFIQRAEVMTLRVKPEDAPEFMAAARSSVEQALLDSNARIVGVETGESEHFAFTYTESGLHGTIHVWGIPGEEANFKLIALITEG